MKRVPLYSRTPERTRAHSVGRRAPCIQRPSQSSKATIRRALVARVAARAHDDSAARALGVGRARVGARRDGRLARLDPQGACTCRPSSRSTSAMRESIKKEPLHSAAANAYEAVIDSVVRVVGEYRDRPPDPKEGEEQEERRHRRGHRGQRHHPDQPARGARRRAHQGHLCQRAGVRGVADRRAARERPGGAAGRDACPTTWKPRRCAPPATCARATR